MNGAPKGCTSNPPPNDECQVVELSPSTHTRPTSPNPIRPKRNAITRRPAFPSQARSDTLPKSDASPLKRRLR